jgi:imidazoleglycerol phosphate dehydratase HisB
VSQGRKVAGGTKRAFGRDKWQDIAIEQFDQQLQGFNANAAVTLGERVGANEHHCPNSWFIKKRTNPNGMTEDDVFLQLLHLVS